MNALVLLLQRKERREKDAEMGRPGEVMNHLRKYINQDYSFYFYHTTEMAMELGLNRDQSRISK